MFATIRYFDGAFNLVCGRKVGERKTEVRWPEPPQRPAPCRRWRITLQEFEAKLEAARRGYERVRTYVEQVTGSPLPERHRSGAGTHRQWLRDATAARERREGDR